jgi:hypothetical protein
MTLDIIEFTATRNMLLSNDAITIAEYNGLKHVGETKHGGWSKLYTTPREFENAIIAQVL